MEVCMIFIYDCFPTASVVIQIVILVVVMNTVLYTIFLTCIATWFLMVNILCSPFEQVVGLIKIFCRVIRSVDQPENTLLPEVCQSNPQVLLCRCNKLPYTARRFLFTLFLLLTFTNLDIAYTYHL